LERFVERSPAWRNAPAKLTFTDDGHQLWRCLPFSCELLSSNGEVWLRRIDRPCRINECFHCEQRPAHERVQLLQGGRRSVGPQPGHGMEQQRYQGECPVSWKYRHASESSHCVASSRASTDFSSRWSRRISKTSRI
jgi:hypothetical protein